MTTTQTTVIMQNYCHPTCRDAASKIKAGMTTRQYDRKTLVKLLWRIYPEVEIKDIQP